MDLWTQLVHSAKSIDDPYHANSLPIYQTATFAQEASFDQPNAYDYSRSGNPTRKVVEDQIARLEQGQFGFAFNSGMAGIYAVVQLLNAGDHLITGQDIYGGTYRLLTKIVSRFGIEVTQVDLCDINAIEENIQKNTKMVLLETPTNPLQQITDIAVLASFLKQSNILLAVDNTFLSPWLQKPLTLGADIVIHSATKHLSGHSDITAGAVVVNDASLAQDIQLIQNASGSALEALPAWLLLRGIKTLGLRIERQQQNAIEIANFLQSHPQVEKVYYCGLPDHPGFDINKKQATGSGTVISFTTQSQAISQYVVDHTRLFITSVSFGSLTSLISLPCQMSHAAIDSGRHNIPPSLVRLSIGIESVDDLKEDLHRCLSSVEYFKNDLGVTDKFS
ncbi:trans-sulfuration enzyme family protein [Facilibium subflavum]|uniref:trans-sulfuration enzyme family protein n=1 Tax=Facilibium subflavum TaxID=2219058 RepID=UPI000E65D80C|nr:PLP-dependent aspartate aminotransferase family protein [Facilibium subflavum]